MTARVLETEAVLEAARAETGLGDFGDDTLPDRVARFVDEIRAACPAEADRRRALPIFHRLLTMRLRFFEDRKRHPLADEKIERPLIATGEPRAGTTLLHALLSVDPGCRPLRFWEVMFPSPTPGLAGSDDERRARADAEWREINARLPKWLVAHPYNDMLGDGLPECQQTWAFDFRVLAPTHWWRVPMTPRHHFPPDPRAQYRLHRMMLQHCQHGRPARTWALKGFHTAQLEALFETYPDARVIWTHRDPVPVIASSIQFAGEFAEALTGRVDWSALAEAQLASSRAACRAMLSDPWVDDPRVHHVRFSDLMADPVATLAGFYERSEVPFTAAAETAIRDYLRDNRSNRHGKFRYSIETIGVDRSRLDAEFAPYRERFGLEIERPD